jgi:adenylate kinase family enzyme
LKIHLLGASGSGTSSIGKKIAESLQIPFFESDDIFWEETSIPFTQKRDIEIRKTILNDIINKNENWVISGSALKWGDKLLQVSDLIILITCPTSVRIQRIKGREFKRFGKRLLPGNDMYQNHFEFLNWASSYDTGGMDMRSLQSERTWLSRASCTTKIVENIDIDHSIKSILSDIQEMKTP